MGNVQNHCWRKWPSAFRAVSSPRAARELNNAWMTLKIVVRRTNMVCKPLHVKVFNLVLYWARNRVLLRGIQPNEKHSPYARSKMSSYAIYNDNLLTATVFSSQNDYTIHDSVLSVNVVPQKCTRWAILDEACVSTIIFSILGKNIIIDINPLLYHHRAWDGDGSSSVIIGKCSST